MRHGQTVFTGDAEGDSKRTVIGKGADHLPRLLNHVVDLLDHEDSYDARRALEVLDVGQDGADVIACRALSRHTTRPWYWEMQGSTLVFLTWA